MTPAERNELTGRVIAACIEVHKELGPGLLESVYEACLMEELPHHNIRARNQIDLPIFYKGKKLDKKFKVDVL
ncbi:GxxExxY protein, partial [candidate division KSB1 bacterium]|nr:GxxExxY protein [candidate division KSB1 bacterium]